MHFGEKRAFGIDSLKMRLKKKICILQAIAPHFRMTDVREGKENISGENEKSYSSHALLLKGWLSIHSCHLYHVDYFLFG